ncbi:MAG: Cof-type HAD-IIB family hydrolase [Planctomycetota bacterium]|nr:MAG: Cof-type HAD-IIB family hydrolase [Planctomycetota bacterium]
MPRFRMLAVDVDGTLVNSNDELTPATQAALRRAAAHGITVVIATGRRYSRTIHLVEPLGIDVPLVTASGALIKSPATHETFFRADFGEELLGQMTRFIAAEGFIPILLGDTFEQGFDYYHPPIERPNPPLEEYLRLNPGCGRTVPDLLHRPPSDVFGAFAMGTQAEMLELQDRLQRTFPGALSTHVLRSPRYTGYFCEIAPGGVTKWSGIRKLAAREGIADETICAVGDDVNDIPMIRAAGLGVAMGNALPEVQAVADRIAPGHDEDGLSTVVDWLLATDDLASKPS